MMRTEGTKDTPIYSSQEFANDDSSFHQMQRDLIYNILNERWNAVYSILTAMTNESIENVEQLIQPTPLHVACSIPSIPTEIIRSLLSFYSSSSCLVEDEDGNLPIHIACSTLDIAPLVIQMLFEACPEASFSGENADGDLPIYLLLQQINGHKVFQNMFDLLPKECFIGRETSLIHEACTRLLPESIMDQILRRYPEIMSLQSSTTGDYIAHSICSHKDSTSSMVRMLLRHDPRLVSRQDFDGNLPLHVVNSDNHSTEIIQILLTAYPEGIMVLNREMETPFSSRLIRFSPSKTRAMIQHSVPCIRNNVLTTRNPKGMLPVEISFYYMQQYLSSICHNNQKEITSSLLRRLSVNNSLLKDMIDSLFHMMNTLCYDSGNRSSDDKMNSLMFFHDPSFWLRFPLLSKLILQEYPNLAFQKDCNGNLPLHAVAKCRRTRNSPMCSICHEEIKSGVYFWWNLNHQQCSKCNSNWKKDVSNQAQIPLVGYQENEILKDLVCVNPSATQVADSNGYLPLHLSLRAGKSWFNGGVKEVFEAAPDALLISDSTGASPVMLASENCDLATVFELFRNNPDL